MTKNTASERVCSICYREFPTLDDKLDHVAFNCELQFSVRD